MEILPQNFKKDSNLVFQKELNKNSTVLCFISKVILNPDIRQFAQNWNGERVEEWHSGIHTELVLKLCRIIYPG